MPQLSDSTEFTFAQLSMAAYAKLSAKSQGQEKPLSALPLLWQCRF